MVFGQSGRSVRTGRSASACKKDIDSMANGEAISPPDAIFFQLCAGNGIFRCKKRPAAPYALPCTIENSRGFQPSRAFRWFSGSPGAPSEQGEAPRSYEKSQCPAAGEKRPQRETAEQLRGDFRRPEAVIGARARLRPAGHSRPRPQYRSLPPNGRGARRRTGRGAAHSGRAREYAS